MFSEHPFANVIPQASFEMTSHDYNEERKSKEALGNGRNNKQEQSILTTSQKTCPSIRPLHLGILTFGT